MQNKQDELEMQEQVADNSNEIINIIKDQNGKSIVIINDIRFKGKQHIDWQAVEQYLKEYVGRHYEIIETSDKIYIGTDFPSELMRYNVFRIEMLVRHASDDKLYLYDMVNVKKEKETEYPA